MYKFSLYVKNKNMSKHLHAYSCSCKVNWKQYELIQDFISYADSVKVWELNNEEGTQHHACTEELKNKKKGINK